MEIQTARGEIFGILKKIRQGEAVVKQEVVTLTATIVTILRRSEAEEKGRGRDGGGECDPGVRRSRARPRRLRAVVGAVRPRRALCDSCQDTAHVVVSCFSCPVTCHKSTGRAALAMRWTA